MKKNLKKVLSLLMAATMTLALSACSSDEDASWPTKDINIIVGYNAGGDADIVTRYMADALSAELGVNVVVTNLSGSNSTLAIAEIIATNDPEYNFVVTNTTAFSTVNVTGVADYTYEDFENAGIFGRYSGETLYVAPDAPYTTLDEFLDYATDNEVTLGVAMGGGLYAACAALQAQGYKINIVDSGDGPERIVALLGGTIDCTFASYATGRDYVENGTILELATLCSEPMSTNPDLPTMCSRVPGIIIDTNFVLLAQQGTSSDVMEAFNQALQNIYANDADYVANVEGYSYQTAEPLTIEDTLVVLEEQLALFGTYAPYLS